MLKKGSAAAKAFMSKLRAARGKKTTKKIGELEFKKGDTFKIENSKKKLVITKIDSDNYVYTTLNNSTKAADLEIYELSKFKRFVKDGLFTPIKKTTLKKVGALSVGFEGKVWKVSFKIINQFDIFGMVQSIIEDKNNGSTITIIDGKGKAADKAKQFASYIEMNGAPDYTTSTQKKSLYGTILKFCENLQKEVKEYNKGNKKTIKKQPLNIPIPKTKKPAAKKPAAKKPIKKTFSNRQYDLRHQAMKPGKRISKEGNKYTENRENRSDKGKLLGIGAITKETLAMIKERSELYEGLKNVSLVRLKNESKLLKGADKAKKLKAIKEMNAFILTLKKQITMLKRHI